MKSINTRATRGYGKGTSHKMRDVAKQCVSACLLLAIGVSGSAGAQHSDWVMTLSWSPEYCEQHRNSSEPQCQDEYYFANFGLKAPDRVGDAKFGDACPDPRLRPEEEDRWLWTIPNLERIRYVWAEQGACSGLDQQAYYAQMDYASRRVNIPEMFQNVERRLATSPAAVKAAFQAANPDITDAAIALHCDARWLAEVQICFDTDMKFSQCVVGGNCSQDVWLRPLRPDRRGPRPQ